MPGLLEYFERNPGTRIVIFAGKGGLGKTTMSASLSYYMATVMGKKVLCFSTDPQASLSDVFERDLFGKGEVEVAPNLYVVEIDADKRIREYQEEIKRKILDMYKLDKIPEEIEEYIESASAEPAMYESATYDAMAELVARGDYDLYVFDMPPFGHGVRMIAMAEVLAAWVDKITEIRREAMRYEAVAASLRGRRVEEDAILNELLEIKKKMSFFREILTDTRRTAFFMVLVPEKMAILDTEKALEMFKSLGINLSGIVVNQVYPRELLLDPKTPEFLKNRIIAQEKYLREIKEKFGKYIVAVVPALDREPKGFEMLGRVAEHLMKSPMTI